MKKMLPALALSLSLISCAPQITSTPDFSPSPQGGIITPTGTAAVRLFSATEMEENADGDSGIGSNQLSPRVTVPEAYIPHEIFEIGLDSDTPDEQIISFKFRDGQDDHIGILLADYDPLRNGYFISWEGMTKATGLKTFSLTTDDVTGNRQLELIITGTNNQGEQTLDIFRQQNSATYGVQLENMLSIEADIEATVNVTERSEFYNNGGSNGAAFTVSALNQDLESDNPLDMIRSVFTWRSGENRYLLSYSEKILGSRIEQDQLSVLYSGDLNDFHQFIDGPWISEDGEKLILFNRTLNTVQMATSDRQLNYYWTNSDLKNIPGNLWVYIVNEIISQDSPMLRLSVLNLNTMNIVRQGEENVFWSGRYTRFNPLSNSSSTFTDDADQKHLYPFGISGLYTSDNGWEMFFSAPNITLRTEEGERSGGYAIFTINDISVLQVNYLDENGGSIEKEQYLIEFSEEPGESSVRREILLRQADINTYGATAVNDELIKLEQVIDLE